MKNSTYLLLSLRLFIRDKVEGGKSVILKIENILSGKKEASNDDILLMVKDLCRRYNIPIQNVFNSAKEMRDNNDV